MQDHASVMRDGGAISSYAETLSGLLSFDRTLARSVREEVEDHLWEAVAAHEVENAGSDPLEAQRRAIANFGDPRRIAAQIAAVSLAGQRRKLGITAILVFASVLLAMATRVAWYDLTEWGLCERAADFGATLGLIDRAAFLLAVAGGITGWAWHRARGSLWAVATGGLVACVICDGLLTWLRLSGWEYTNEFLVPLSSMAIEAACAAMLIFHVHRLARISAVAA